jgi:hypothetical protein
MKQAAAATAAKGGFGRNTFFNLVRNAYLEAERGDGTETPASRKAREDHERASCCSFALVMIFFCVFLWMMMLHESVSNVFPLERSLKHQLTEYKFGAHSHTFLDIHDSDVFWEWVELALEPALVNHEDVLGHTLPHSEWGYLAKFNKVIGGIRLLQDRGSKEACGHHRMDRIYDVCYPLSTDEHHDFGLPPCNTTAHGHRLDCAGVGLSDDDVDGQRRRLSGGDCGGARQSRRRRGLSSTTDDNNSDSGDDDGYDALHNFTSCYCDGQYLATVDTVHDEGFTYDDDTGHFEMWLDLQDPEETILKRSAYLEDRHWIDKQTSVVTVELLIYNGQQEALLSEVVLEFAFDRTGYITTHVLIESVSAYP